MSGLNFNLEDISPGDFAHFNSTNMSMDLMEPDPSYTLRFGLLFYSRVTPFLLVIGIFGNILVLVVFLRRNMRNLSASNYLAALAFTDLLSLITFVLVEWLRDGLPYLLGEYEYGVLKYLNMDHLCRTWLYFSYVCRFISAWIVIIFTFERYIAVCFPLRRRDLCTVRGSRNAVAALAVVTLLLMGYKPALSGWNKKTIPDFELESYRSSYNTAYNNIQESTFLNGNANHNHSRYACVATEKYEDVSFILDAMYGFSITLLPFVVITAFNLLIIRKLVITNRRTRNNRIRSEENLIKLEFTAILIVISFCFIAFNLPYFAVWLHQYILNHEKIDVSSQYNTTRGLKFIARTIFSLNYCVNFFLYSITGAYFRREVKNIFRYCVKKSHRHNDVTRQSSRTTWV